MQNYSSVYFNPHEESHYSPAELQFSKKRIHSTVHISVFYWPLMMFHVPDMIPHSTYFKIPQVEAGWSKEHFENPQQMPFRRSDFEFEATGCDKTKWIKCSNDVLL